MSAYDNGFQMVIAGDRDKLDQSGFINNAFQRVMLGLKRTIDRIYTGGIDAILAVNIEIDQTITGKFRDQGEVFDFTISPQNELDYVESSARSDAYLVGWAIDSGNILGVRRDRAPRKKSRCLNSKPCRGSCISKGYHCKVQLSNKEAAELDGIRNTLTEIKSSREPATPEEVSERWGVGQTVAAGVITGALLTGMSVGAYMVFRQQYREGFKDSAQKVESKTDEVESELKRQAAERTGKPEEELTREEIYTVERYPAGSDKKRTFSVDPDKPNITFTVGGFNDYGEDGTGMATTLKRSLDEDSIIPLTNKKVQISAEDTFLPMNDLLDDTLDPDGQGGQVERGFFARRGVTSALKTVLGDRYSDWVGGLRNSDAYKTVEPVARMIIRNSRDLGLLARNAVQEGYHADAVDIAANIESFHKAYPDKPVRIVAHSGGGSAAAEAAEILKLRGIEVKVANIGSPYFGLTDLPPEQLITIAGKGDYMMNLPAQNRVEVSDVTAHNWIGGGGTRGYGNSSETQEVLRRFFYGDAKAKRTRKAKKDSRVLTGGVRR